MVTTRTNIRHGGHWRGAPSGTTMVPQSHRLSLGRTHLFKCNTLGRHLNVSHVVVTTNAYHWDASPRLCAAGRGLLEVVQWYWTSGCPLEEGICASAAANGHVGVLH